MANKKNDILKGILMGVADYAQYKADDIKLKAQAKLLNERMKNNWIYRLQYEADKQKADRENQLQRMQDFQQYMNQNQENGDMNIETPTMQMSEGGNLFLKTPTSQDKEFKIKLGLNRIALKERKGMTLTPAEQNFKDIYSGMVKNPNITDVSDLTNEQQIQARSLSRKLYGVRGAEFGLPAIYEEMRKGKTIDDIEDTLRYAGQSKEFSGPIRDAAQTILMNTDQNKAQTSMDYIDDLLSKGDTEGVKSQLKRLSKLQAGNEEARNMNGKERTIKLLSEIQGDLNNLERMGINTNIFTGTTEQIASKLGMVKNPEARKVATKIAVAIQNYRRSMTGVQFGMPENREYKVMFPSIGRTANFNSANINALKEVMQGDLDNFYSLSMGEENYKKLFGGGIRNLEQQNNTLKTLDKTTAQQFLNQAKGDKELARKLAQQSGYNF